MIERLRVQGLAGVSGEFSSPDLTLCADCFSASVPPRVTAVARKRPGHSTKSVGDRLHLNNHSGIHTPSPPPQKKKKSSRRRGKGHKACLKLDRLRSGVSGSQNSRWREKEAYT